MKVGDRFYNDEAWYSGTIRELYRVIEVERGHWGGIKAVKVSTQNLPRDKWECLLTIPSNHTVIPIEELLVYSAEARCPCGAGLAYIRDPGEDEYFWDCSKIMLGTADKGVKHTAQLPFLFYEIKSELQPSAEGRSTRPR